MTKDLVCFWPA